MQIHTNEYTVVSVPVIAGDFFHTQRFFLNYTAEERQQTQQITNQTIKTTNKHFVGNTSQQLNLSRITTAAASTTHTARSDDPNKLLQQPKRS